MPEYNLQYDSDMVTLHVPGGVIALLTDALDSYKRASGDDHERWGSYEQYLLDRLNAICDELAPAADI